MESVFAADEVEDGWIYAPPQQTRDVMSGEVRTGPYSARVFGLSKTHVIEHAAATGEDHLDFHVWSLSFFLGTRLSTTDAGFLDTPTVKRGSFVDFVLLGPGLEEAVALTDRFWTKNLGQPRDAKRFASAIHALFLGQYRQALQFEEFIYLYAALDACFALTRATTGRNGPRAHPADQVDVRTIGCGDAGVGQEHR